jgi:hypothetical protein
MGKCRLARLAMSDPKGGPHEASYSTSNPHMRMEEPSQLSMEDEKREYNIPMPQKTQ